VTPADEAVLVLSRTHAKATDRQILEALVLEMQMRGVTLGADTATARWLARRVRGAA
jgi:hypothetical protein